VLRFGSLSPKLWTARIQYGFENSLLRSQLAGPHRAQVAAGSCPARGALVDGAENARGLNAQQQLVIERSERRTLQKVSEGEFQVGELDWIALQRLKALGLVEERNTVAVITPDGRRVLQGLIGNS
jgi:hypothetical protein